MRVFFFAMKNTFIWNFLQKSGNCRLLMIRTYLEKNEITFEIFLFLGNICKSPMNNKCLTRIVLIFINFN